jgi:pimeloyl-ACP methyl ester carboxylesterase
MNGSALQDGWGTLPIARGRISFLVSGAGGAEPPLVLLPSLGGDAGHWGAFGGRLAAERCTLALDPPGFGRSSPPPVWLSTRSLAERLLAALDSLGIPDFDLFGCSLGALFASRMALLAPRRVHRLVLASAAARGRDFAPRRLSRAVQLARDFVANPHPKPAIARDIAERPEATAPQPQPQVAGASWSRGRVLRYLGAALAHDVSDELDRVHMPVLLLHGERDVLLGASAQRRLRERLPHAKTVTLRGVGHDLVNDAPDACADAVLPFLRER